MRVKVKGVGAVKKYIEGRKTPYVNLPPEASILDLIKKLNLNPQLVAMVTVNGRVVGKDYKPKEGDEVFLMNIFSGG
ncbi:MAG: MoaD/ThiS family protein [Acidobacteria bacterium]|nr:MoaD/ThiS family protein [Acidobacteriota bacterium]